MSLRERTRAAVRAELAALALEMFAERGFEETTVDEVARAAGMSKRSLFRYFPTKEDMVLGSAEAMGEAVAAELRARPEGEAPWESLRVVLCGWEERISSSAERLARLRLVEESPALHARWVQRREEARREIAAVLRERAGAGAGAGLDAFSADLLTSAAGAALESATREWLRSNGQKSRPELLTEAFTRLNPT
ncbi:TetR family transcriptional regulator [Streptomyces albiaxialis]|uniref:TetR family transcriptional regulator n=1 Tax=Streptomyces albiaxialis TaxID=329523 RepID=A0ABP5HD97_9ACTN